MRELEIRIGMETGTLILSKDAGRGGWYVEKPPYWLPFGDERREAREMLATLRFANKALEAHAWIERERMRAA